jgi:hypothetical protein
MPTELITHTDMLTHEIEETRPFFSAIAFLRHSGIQSYVSHQLNEPQTAAKTMLDEFSLTASFWNASYTVQPDFDANNIYTNPAHQIRRIEGLRLQWWNQGNKQERMRVDEAFTEYTTLTERTLDLTQPDMLSKPNPAHFTLNDELWHLLTSQDITNRVNTIIAKSGNTFEDTWLAVAKSSLVFCLMIQEKQRETGGTFLPNPKILRLPEEII